MKCKKEGCNRNTTFIYRPDKREELPYCEEHWFETYDRKKWV